jgi:hypothetical protein
MLRWVILQNSAGERNSVVALANIWPLLGIAPGNHFRQRHLSRASGTFFYIWREHPVGEVLHARKMRGRRGEIMGRIKDWKIYGGIMN